MLSNEQCFRVEHLETSGLFSDTKVTQLERAILKFKKMNVKVDTKNMKSFHWLKSNYHLKKMIISLSKL